MMDDITSFCSFLFSLSNVLIVLLLPGLMSDVSLLVHVGKHRCICGRGLGTSHPPAPQEPVKIPKKSVSGLQK